MLFKRKGEITVFMALILSVICVFITGLIKNAKCYEEKGRIILAADAAIRSVFAEYNRRLYEEYHLLYIDPSYKGYENNQDQILDHFLTYMSANLNQGGYDGLNSLAISQGNLTKVVKLSDSKEDLTNQINKSNLLAYIIECFGSGKSPRQNRVRAGEIEYLIYGNKNDYMNISKANSEYEKEIYGEINPSRYSGNMEPTRNRGRVNTTRKKKTDYKSYEEFLYEKLEEKSEELLLSRIKRLITEDMRENGSPAFDFDSLVLGVEINVDVTISNNENVSVVREYHY